jgi:Carboxypeptidase regulatory-like domain
MKRAAIVASVMNSVVALVLLTMLCAVPQISAQNVASLNGVVTDKSGAVVPEVSVRLLDTKTNESYLTKTNELGGYTFPRVAPGPGYSITFTKEGFSALTIANLYLATDSAHTQNAELQVGQVTESVEVNGAGTAVSLDTTDATVGNNFDIRLLHELPIQIRDSPAGLLALQPGVTTSPLSDPNASRDGAVTGSRTDQGNITLDGLDVNDFATGQAFATVANAPVDSIQEFRGETANPLSAEGRGSGAQISLVTKSGTNTWHGSAYEYNRTAATEANTYFNNLDGIPRTQLTRNQFGASLGGPIKKDKLFFFFNYQGRRDATEVSQVNVVPLDAFRNGELSYINDGTGCTASSRINTQPGCITTLTSAQVAAMDPLKIGHDVPLLNFINGRYPHANDLTVGDGVNTGGFRFNAPADRTANDYVTRIDYNFTSKMKLFGRISILRDTSGDDVNFVAPILFPGDPVSHTIVDRSYAYVIGDTWTISNNKINQFVYGETQSQLDFPTLFNPTGSTQYPNFMNNGSGTPLLTSPYLSGSSQYRNLPVPVYRDDFTYVQGKHTWQMGGMFKPIKDYGNLTSDFNNVTLGLGGGLASLGPGFEPGNILVDANGIAPNLWDSAFAFDLGRFGSIESDFNNGRNLQPLPLGSPAIRDYRYYETEAYIQDTWRMRSDLTMTYGLRYQFYSVPYETNGLEANSNADFDSFYNARASNALQGISGTNSLPLVYYNLAGKANNAPGFYRPDYKDFAPRLSIAYNPSFSNGFLGRLFGDRKTVVRAGAGIVFDHPPTAAIAFFQNQNSFLFANSADTNYGLSGDPATALATDPRFTAIGVLPPGLNKPSPITLPYAPFTSGGVPNGYLNNALTYSFDPNLKTPYSETISFGFQRELPGNFLLESTYFGRFGRRLLAQADAGQITNFRDPTSGQTLDQAFGTLTQQMRAQPGTNGYTVTPQPFFENLVGPGGTSLIANALTPLALHGDIGTTLFILGLNDLLPPGVGFSPQFIYNIFLTNKSASDYNGLLTTLHKKLSHGLQFDFNYTFSHSIDNTSVPGNNFSGQFANFSGGVLCDSTRPKVCRANSEFDLTHLISADGIYDLPFGRGRTFGSNMSGWLNEIVGGWQLSGIDSWQSGFAFSTVANAFPYSFNNNVPAFFNGDGAAIRTKIHQVGGQVQMFANPTAAIGAFSGPIGQEAGNRNSLRGPNFSNVDLALSKHFPITEKYGMEFRAEAYNVFNRTNFALPGVAGSTLGTADITNPSQFGVITQLAGNPREMQFSLRLDF